MDKNNTSFGKNSENNSKRRKFIKNAAFAGAGSLIASAEAVGQTKPVRPERRLRIGALAVGDMSFWDYTWGDILSPHGMPVNRGSLGTDVLNMEITHVWDVNPSKAQAFASKVGAQVVSKYDDMVGRVDGVALGGFYEVPWQNRLALPYLESGTPTHLSRPFAYSLRDIDEILEIAAKHNTPILATDLYEHIFAVNNLKRSLKNVGEIQCVQATCLTHDYPALFHTQFMLPKILGYDIERISVFTDNPNESTYLVGNYLYKGRDGQPPFVCSQTMTPKGDLFSITIRGTEGVESSRLPQIADWQDDLLTHHLPMLVAMQRTFEGKNYEPFDLVRKKTELFLTGFYSALERKGAPVNVGTVPADWRGRPVKPDWIDEAVFKR
jgi:hypothetical protein